MIASCLQNWSQLPEPGGKGRKRVNRSEPCGSMWNHAEPWGTVRDRAEPCGTVLNRAELGRTRRTKQKETTWNQVEPGQTS